MTPAPESLAQLAARRRKQLGISLREASERSDGLISHGALHDIEVGQQRRPTDRILRGVALALDLPVKQVYRAAGVAHPVGPFVLPERAHRLSAKERKVIVAMIDTLLAAHDASEGDG